MSNFSVYKLNTPKAFSRLMLVVSLTVASLLLTNCGKKCQTNTNSVKSLSENGVRWRLVETNNKATEFRKVNLYTFFVLKFEVNFTGNVISVVNNNEFGQTNTCTLKYKPADGQMAVEFSGSSGTDGNGEATTSACPFAGTQTFEYSLGRNLKMTNIKTGVYYNFVQYLGVVEPDKVCTF